MLPWDVYISQEVIKGLITLDMELFDALPVT